jgi:hypothetical protein
MSGQVEIEGGNGEEEMAGKKRRKEEDGRSGERD